MEKAAFNKTKKTVANKTDLEVRSKQAKVHDWCTGLYVAVNWQVGFTLFIGHEGP
jgi:hypothetical protein